MQSRDIKRLREGNDAAFRLVYEQFSERVYRLAFRFLKDIEQSEEIVQEVFLNLWLSREKLDVNGNMWLYLYVIAKRLCLNALREIHKSTDLFNRLLANIKEASNLTEEEIIAADIGRLAEEIVSRLPKQQQLIFRLSRTEGLSHQEIAERLHISPNTVKNHMVQALKALRTHLKCSDLIYFIVFIFR